MVALEEDMEMKHPTHYKEIMVDPLLLIMVVTLLKDNPGETGGAGGEWALAGGDTNNTGDGGFARKSNYRNKL